MAGRLAFNPISARARPGTGQSMRNYRPEFESVILGKPSDRLDSSKMQALGGIINDAYSEADRKGAGAKVREVFRDFAARIDNNIVKLASQRIRDVAREVKGEHLQGFLEVMHKEMLANQDRADAIPEAMLSAYRMSGGRLDARTIARAVRIGFSKSKTLCPKEVSAVVKSEYESGGLDHISEIAALRNPSPPKMEFTFELRAGAAQDGCQAQAAAVPEAVPLAYFLQPKVLEEKAAPLAGIAQNVPEIVASKQREEVSRMRNLARGARSADAPRTSPQVRKGAQAAWAPPVERRAERWTMKDLANAGEARIVMHPSSARAAVPLRPSRANDRRKAPEAATVRKDGRREAKRPEERAKAGTVEKEAGRAIAEPGKARASRAWRGEAAAKGRKKRARGRGERRSGILSTGRALSLRVVRKIASLIKRKKLKAPADKASKRKRDREKRDPSKAWERMEKPKTTGKRLKRSRAAEKAEKRRAGDIARKLKSPKAKTAPKKKKPAPRVEAPKTRRARRDAAYGTVCSSRARKGRKPQARRRKKAVARPFQIFPRAKPQPGAGSRKSGEIIYKLVVQS